MRISVIFKMNIEVIIQFRVVSLKNYFGKIQTNLKKKIIFQNIFKNPVSELLES